MIGSATAIVAATVLTTSTGSIIAAFDVLQAGRDGIAGAGQVLPEPGEVPGIRLESSEVEVGKSVKTRVVLNVGPVGLPDRSLTGRTFGRADVRHRGLGLGLLSLQ